MKPWIREVVGPLGALAIATRAMAAADRPNIILILADVSMKASSLFWAAVRIASSTLGASAQSRADLPDTLHQEVLKAPEPDGRRPVAANPPTFRWPAFGTAPYVVELSRRESFDDATRRPPVRNLFDRPAGPLAPGRYWW